MSHPLALIDQQALSAQDALGIAKDILLSPHGIDESFLRKTLALMHHHQLDDADLYFQRPLS